MESHPIVVAVRMRPPLEDEIIVKDEQLKLDVNTKRISIKNLWSIFDGVYDEKSTNLMIYNEIVAPKIKNLIEGFNVTILAYGSTGSGKTYTMGTNMRQEKYADPGLIPLGMNDIFKEIESCAFSDVTLSASFFEIYLEEVNDLLSACNTNLLIRGDSQELKIVNLTEVTIKSVGEALELLRKGNQIRHTDTTAKNSCSSRSHAIFTLNINLVDKITGHSKKSKFQLVDLAGSERTKTSKTEGQQFKQGLAINKALSTLSRVINSLYKKDRHIPYRDSSLTRILQDSFGGNSYTVMITCVSPSLSSFEETLSTLRYAQQALSIKNTPVINKDMKEAQIEKLQSQIKAYEEELKKYRNEEKDWLTTGEKTEKTLTDPFKTTSEKAFIEVQIASSVGKISSYFNEISDDLQSEKIELIKKEINNLFSLCNINEPESLQLNTEVQPQVLSESEELEDTEKNQLVLNEIKNINLNLKNKEQDLRHWNYVFEVINVQHDTENIHQLLIDKIERMQEEKKALVEKTEKIDNIKKLEENIKMLEEQLKSKETISKVSISKREECLKNEIKALKTSKVELIKRCKEEVKAQKQKVLEDSKKFASLEKEFRKNQILWKRKEFSLENKLKILEKKVTDVQSSQKTKFPPKSKAKHDSSKKCSSIDILSSLKEIIHQEISLEKEKAQIESFENEAKKLQEQIEKDEDGAADSIKSRWENINNLTKKIKEMKKTLKDNITAENLSLDFISNLEDSKAAIKLLIQKIKSTENEKAKIHFCLEKSHLSIENLEATLEKIYSENLTLSKEIEELKSNEKNKKLTKKRKIKSPNKKDADKSTLMLTYLVNQGDESFESTSDLNDPDFRATPINKRTLKRKNPETTQPEEDEIPVKKISHGCDCPTSCTTLRCSCQKKHHVCGAYCTCSKEKCLNISSTSGKNIRKPNFM